MTEQDRKDKLQLPKYRCKAPSKVVICPACANKALLNKNIESTSEEHENYYIVRKNVILKDLTCHYCGLNINERDLLLLHYSKEEESLPDARYYRMYFDDEYIFDCPDDCPPEDCPEDCPPEDCPEDYLQDDCPQEDCPEDCPLEDCPEDCPLEDCPEDCPPEDCPEDCPPEDCPSDDCPPEDCPEDCPLEYHY